MLFNSLEFVAFLLVAFVVYRLVHRWRLPRTLWLLLCSYLFYASWDPRYLWLIAASTLIDWHVGKGLALTEAPGRRKLLLAASLAGNLGLLGFFKYGNFVVENVEALLALAGAPSTLPRVPGVLPVGISFYTFQTLSYTIDLYRRRVAPARTLLEFATYVAFFPQLVAGPIVRAKEFLPQLERRPRLDPAALGEGLAFIVAGLLKKMVVADSLRALIVQPFFDAPSGAGAVEALVSTWAFYFALYCDFSGYTDVAMGAGLLFGFQLPVNFRRPGWCTSPLDHWRRWHITLHDWLLDYVFIPLGGSRAGPARTFVNIVLTFTVGGIWHGAGWTFALMGVYNGALGAAWRVLRPKPSTNRVIARIEGLIALQLVALSMVFMWPYGMADAWKVLEALFASGEVRSGSLPAEGLLWLGVAVALHYTPLRLRDGWRQWLGQAPAPVVAVIVLLAAGICSLYSGVADEFYYFRF